MFLIFDGTGPVDDGEYAVINAWSHCRRLSKTAPGPTFYYRGTTGMNPFDVTASGILLKTAVMAVESGGLVNGMRAAITERTSDEAFLDLINPCPPDRSCFVAAQRDHADAMKQVTRRLGSSKIFIAAHSRGALSALLLAWRMKKELPSVKIDAMFLYDAVNMTIVGPSPGYPKDWAHVVPNNVVVCYHATRSKVYFANLKHRSEQIQQELEIAKQGATDWANLIPDPYTMGNSEQADLRIEDYDAKLRELHAIENELTMSRSKAGSPWYDWENAATMSEKGVKMVFKDDVGSYDLNKGFDGSHGAIGGAFSPDIKDDEFNSKIVGKWMDNKIAKHVQLRFRTGEIYHPHLSPGRK